MAQCHLPAPHSVQAQSGCQRERHSCPVSQEPRLIGQGESSGIWSGREPEGLPHPSLALDPSQK